MDSEGKEIGFVGFIGSDKEIRFRKILNPNGDGTSLPAEEFQKQLSIGQQASAFIAGHSHPYNETYRSMADQLHFLGTPTPPKVNGAGRMLLVDYQMLLKGFNQEFRPTPLLIGTREGITIYGSTQDGTKSTIIAPDFYGSYIQLGSFKQRKK